MRKKLWLSLFSAGILAISAQVSAEDLTIGFADPLSSLDPHLNNFAGDRSSSLHFFNMLVQLHADGLTPDLAVSWQPLDKTTWEFKLRPDVHWTDGEPLKAEDVVFSIKRADHVSGSTAPYSGFVRSVEDIYAKDDNTVIVKTKNPAPNLPLDLSSVHIASKHVGENAKPEDYNSGKALIGTGPYVLESYVPGDRVILNSNKDYWDGVQPWDRVVYRFISNPTSRTAALLSGDVDVIDKVSLSDLATLKKSDKVSVYSYPGLRVLLMQPSFRAGPNEFIKDNSGEVLAENPLLNPKVRQALSISINREAIADRVMQDTVTTANQWMPKDTFGYNSDLGDIEFDPKKAKQLLAEAGFPEGFQLTIHVPSDRYPGAVETATAVGQLWSRIGVKTNVEVVPWAVYSSKARSNEYAVSMIGWGNGTAEGSYAMVHILSTVDPDKGLGASNWGHYSSERLDNYLAQASQEFDADKRAEIISQAAAAVREENGVIPIFHYKNIWAARKGLEVQPWTSDRTVAMMVTKVKDEQEKSE